MKKQSMLCNCACSHCVMNCVATCCCSSVEEMLSLLLRLLPLSSIVLLQISVYTCEILFEWSHCSHEATRLIRPSAAARARTACRSQHPKRRWGVNGNDREARGNAASAASGHHPWTDTRRWGRDERPKLWWNVGPIRRIHSVAVQPEGAAG